MIFVKHYYIMQNGRMQINFLKKLRGRIARKTRKYYILRLPILKKYGIV